MGAQSQVLTYTYRCPKDPGQVHVESVKQGLFGSSIHAELECASCKSRLPIVVGSAEETRRGLRGAFLLGAAAAPIGALVAYWSGSLALSWLRDPVGSENRRVVFGFFVVLTIFVFALGAFILGMYLLGRMTMTLWRPFLPIEGRIVDKGYGGWWDSRQDLAKHRLRGLSRADRRRTAT